MTEKDFEKALSEDLFTYLRGLDEIDERFPEMPDISAKWDQIARSYLPDGIREFAKYPTSSLGWMMYIGMAVAQFWDEDWNVYSSINDLYVYLRDKRGYDYMDEYIRQAVLKLSGREYQALEKLVGECASRTNNKLIRAPFEPGTPVAFHAYTAALHQLFLTGAAVQLYRLGYHSVPLL